MANGAGGRPRKSSAAHHRDGTFRADRHQSTEAELTFTGGEPRMPGNFTEPQRSLWGMVVSRIPPDHLGEIDGPALTALCRWWRLYVFYDEELWRREMAPDEEYKLMIATAMAWKQCEKLLRQFGMTPAARQLIKDIVAVNSKDGDPLGIFKDVLHGGAKAGSG